MPLSKYVCLCLIITILSVQSQAQQNKIRISEGLYVVKLKENLYQHVSDFEYQSALVQCNGLIYINGRDAVICDTPVNDTFSAELLRWFSENHPGVSIKAIIVNHFHSDCLGGLKEFHKAGIKSYAHRLGPELMKLKGDSSAVPQNLFSKRLKIKVGDSNIENFYPGEAHTKDNIVTWIPDEKTIFGGCMVKSMNAEKGYLGDANVNAWSATMRKIKLEYPSAKLIIPGHGDAGGQELLDYTMRLFESR
jgi:metallo-beta-lactamase class B